jgi:hypothetical protein
MRFDPTFLEHERWERLGADALVLHLAAVAYTVRTLSDGKLTLPRVRTLTPLVAEPDAVAASLVDDGLWQVLDDGLLEVCQVHEDLRRADGRGDEQPSRSFVEHEREKARERKDKWRQSQKSGNAVPTPDPSSTPAGNAVPNGGRNGTQCSAEQSSAVQDPKGPSPASAHAPDGSDPTTSGNAVPLAVQGTPPPAELSDAPLGTSRALWQQVWQRAWADMAPDDRSHRGRLVLNARQLLSEEPTHARSEAAS